MEDRIKKSSEALERACRRIASQEQVVEQLEAKLAELVELEERLIEERKSLESLETEENRQ